MLVAVMLASVAYSLSQGVNERSMATLFAPSGGTEAGKKAVGEQTIPITAPELQSTTTATGNTYITDLSVPIQGRCEVITLECLQAQPEWNPTPSARGIQRIGSDELTILDDANVFTSNIQGILVAKQQFRGGKEYCSLTNTHPSIANFVSCSEFGPSMYREIAYLNTETEEVLHAFRLIDGYSFLQNINGGEGNEMYSGFGAKECESGVYFYTHSWSGYGPDAQIDNP